MKPLLTQFFLNYLTIDQLETLLSNPIRSKAWNRLLDGYSDVEIEEILISTYEFSPDRLPSIAQIQERCIDPIDQTRYQKEWNLILEVCRRSLTYQEKHNLLTEKLSPEVKLTFKDLGGIMAIQNTELKYLSRKDFIANCQKYKRQLKAKLIEPLEDTYLEIPKAIVYEEIELSPEDKTRGATIFAFNNAYFKKYGLIPPRVITAIVSQIDKALSIWEDKSEQGLKQFKDNFLNTHPWLTGDHLEQF